MRKIALFVTLLFCFAISVSAANPVVERRTTTGQIVAAASKGLRVIKIFCTETSNAAGATVDVYHGTSAVDANKLVSTINLAENESTSRSFDSAAWPLASDGVWIVITGAAECVIHTWKY